MLQSMSDATASPKRLAFFERYLTVWVFLCMVVGVAFGKLAPAFTAQLSRLQFGRGSQVNVPIGVLLWLMIYPMMLKVDFSALGGIARKPKGLAVTLFVNWLVKPFSMAFLAWLFMQHVFSAWIDRNGEGIHRRSHHPGRGALHGHGVCVELSHRRRPGLHARAGGGERPHHAVRVRAHRDVSVRRGHVVVPAKVLITSVVVFIVIPLAAGWLTRTALA
jgi:arsenite transporter